MPPEWGGYRGVFGRSDGQGGRSGTSTCGVRYVATQLRAQRVVARVRTRFDCGTPTAMSGSRRIDTYQDDRGLTTCFAGANILEEWKSELVHAHKWETLEDFVYYFNETAMETSLDQVLQPTKMKDNRLLRARLKAAHAAGLEAIRAAAAEAKQPEAVDETLPESTMQQLHKDFAAKYGVVFGCVLGTIRRPSVPYLQGIPQKDNVSHQCGQGPIHPPPVGTQATGISPPGRGRPA